MNLADSPGCREGAVVEATIEGCWSLPEIEIRRWMNKARALLSRYKDHPQFEDLVATAHLHMWDALRRADWDRCADAERIAMTGVWNAISRFFRDPVNVTRKYTSRRNPLPEIISLQEWMDGARPDKAQAVEPDFAPRLIEYLAARQELAKMPDRKQRALLLFAEGWTPKEIMHIMGVSRDVVYKLLAGCSAIEYNHPGPDHAAGERGRQTRRYRKQTQEIAP